MGVIVTVLAAVASMAMIGCGGNESPADTGQSPADTTYTVPSEAMEPTLDVGEEVQVDLDAYDSQPPQIGDVVVLHPPAGAVTGGRECGVSHGAMQVCPKPVPRQALSTTFVKRVVAGPGDRLKIVDGHPVVNGQMAQEDFARQCRGSGLCNFPLEIAIPPGHYFLLGDNRSRSDDSRFWGPVPSDYIFGKVVSPT